MPLPFALEQASKKRSCSLGWM
uniref:Uncharacterized protein n=1 Tax=Arundo donax TaxID=35708 RepID=A0A0A9FGX7_ARUDO